MADNIIYCHMKKILLIFLSFIALEISAVSPKDFVDIKWKSRFGTEFLFFTNKTGIMTRSGKTVPFKWSRKGELVISSTEPQYFFKFEKDGKNVFGVKMTDIDQELVKQD